MKTTIEIADALLQDARDVAAADGLTLRALVEEGLREAVHRRRHRTPFHLRDASFEGQGLQGAYADGDWSKVREAAYEGRGT